MNAYARECLIAAFIYGTYALAGASVMGIGLLCYYGLGMSKEASIMSQSAYVLLLKNTFVSLITFCIILKILNGLV